MATRFETMRTLRAALRQMAGRGDWDITAKLMGHKQYIGYSVLTESNIRPMLRLLNVGAGSDWLVVTPPLSDFDGFENSDQDLRVFDIDGAEVGRGGGKHGLLKGAEIAMRRPWSL